MPFHRHVAVLTIILASGASVVSASAATLEEQIVAQLTCEKAPEPLPILKALQEKKRFKADDGQMMDSSTCWQLKPALVIDGMTFDNICASSEDPQMIADYPDFFWRGPGTSAGNGLALTSKEPAEAVRSWAEEALGGTHGKYEVAESLQVENATAVSCNSLTFLAQ